MYIDESSRNIQYPCFPKNRFLSFVKTEAEYILNAWNATKYMRPSWDPYVTTKYDRKDEDCLRISNICTYVILFFFSIIILGGFFSIVFWLPVARYTLLVAEYYIGIAITIIFTVIYISTRKLLERFLIKISPNKSVGQRRYIYIDLGIVMIMEIILLVLQLVWKLPFGILVLYFPLFISIYAFVIMLIYLIIRLKSNKAEQS